MVRATMIWLALLVSHVMATDPKVGDVVFYRSGAEAKRHATILNTYDTISWPAKVESVFGDSVWLGAGSIRIEDVMKLDEAFNQYDLAVKQNPESARSWRNRGACLREKGDLRGAMSDYDQAIRLNPEDFAAFNGRAAVKEMTQDLDGAIKDYDKSIELSYPRANLFVNRGRTKCMARDFDGAIQDLETAIGLDPENATAYFERGVIRYLLKDFTTALEDFEKSIVLNDHCARAYQFRGRIKNEFGDLNGALSDFKLAIHKAPSEASFYVDSGWCYQLQGFHVSAIVDYEKADKLEPNDIRSKSSLAFLYATCPKEMLRDGLLALEWSERALKIDAKNPYALNSKACALALVGRFDEAVDMEMAAMENGDYAFDDELDGGIKAKERIAAWKEQKLWLTAPIN